MKSKYFIGAIMLLAILVITGCRNKNQKKSQSKHQETVELKPNCLLIIVDPQVDFTTGSLAVSKGPQAMDTLSEILARGYYKKYTKIIVTQDFHPANHCSFVEQGGIFPPHCVQGTEGVCVYPKLQAVLNNLSNIDVEYLTKGNKKDKEEFSIFQNEINADHITKLIKTNNYDSIDICGIASDYCVYETLKDLISFYPAKKVCVAMNCIASVSDDEKLPAFMKKMGVKAVLF